MTADSQSAGARHQSLVLYDGVCGLCNRLVHFLLRHDRNNEFLFAPLQSERAQAVLGRHGMNSTDCDSVVVIADYDQLSEHTLIRSEAALWATVRLGGGWRLMGLARVVPLRLREAAYQFIARHRYRMFGKYSGCPLPNPEDATKFLAD